MIATRRRAGQMLLATVCAAGVRPDVAFAGLPPVSIAPRQDAARIVPAYFGIHVHNDGAQRRWPDIPVGSIRLWDANVGWSDLEPEAGRWNFARLDEYVDWARERGIEVVMTLGLVPRWAAARPDEAGAYGPGSASEPADLADWRHYVRRVATRYRGRVAAYEVCNEANLPLFFSGTPQVLAQLTQIAGEEVSRADPAALRVGPSGTGLEHSRVAWLGRLLRLGVRDAVDVVAFHLYRYAGPPEAMIEPVTTLLAHKAAAGAAALPIWNTEAGYMMPNPDATWQAAELRDMISAERVAEYLPRDLLLARAFGFERYHWYDWDGNKMGLLDPATGGRRRAADVYAQCIRTFSHATLHRCQRDAQGLWTCTLSLPDGGAALALWVDPAAPRPQLMPDIAGPIAQMVLDGRSTWRSVTAPLRVGPVVTLVSVA